MDIVISTFDKASLAGDAFKLREKIFIEEQKIPAHLDKDEDDHSSIHMVIYNHQKDPVATGRLSFKENKTGQLSRIAVVKACRGNGLASRVLAELEKIAKEHNLVQLYLHPHAHLESWYEKFGYQRTNDPIETFAYMQLIKMQKDIT